MAVEIPTDLEGCLALLPDNENGAITAEAMRAIVTCQYNQLEEVEQYASALGSALESLNVNYQMLNDQVMELQARVAALEGGA